MLNTLLIIVLFIIAIIVAIGINKLVVKKHDPLAFIPNPGYQPVPDGMLIDVEYESGEISYGVKAGVEGAEGQGSIPGLFAVSWRLDPDMPWTIRSWRLHIEHDHV